MLQEKLDKSLTNEDVCLKMENMLTYSNTLKYASKQRWPICACATQEN